MGEGGFDHITALHGGEVILRRPAFGVEFAQGGNLSGLERLEQHIRVAIKVELYLVDVMGAFAKRYILAPVVRVARQGDLFAGFIVSYHIGAGAQRYLRQRGVGEIAALPLRLAQDRAHPCQQCQLSVVGVEHHLNAARTGLGDAVDLGIKPVVARVPLSAEHVVAKDHIFGGDRTAIGETRVRSQGEFDPGPVLRDLNRFGQKPVKRERFIPRTAHQAFMGKERQLPRRGALAHEGIEAVKPAGVAQNDRAALGCVRVGIGQRHKIRWESRVPIHRYTMCGLGAGESTEKNQ